MFTATKPSKKRRFLLKISLFIIAFFLIGFYQKQSLTSGVAPTFMSKNLTGQTIGLTDQPKQATLVHFWATWCSICSLENSNIQAIVKDNKYPVLNIARQSGSDESLKNYALDNQLDLATIVNDFSGSLSKLYRVEATPISFIIDKKGIIAFRDVGYTTELSLKLKLWWANL